MKNLFLITPLFLCATLFGFNADTIVAHMEETGRKTLMGRDDSCGVYLVCREEVSIERDINQAREQAKMNARRTISEILSVSVSAETTQEKKAINSVCGEIENFSQTEAIQSLMKKDINQVQRGLVVCQEKVQNGKIAVYCLLTEQVIDATRELESANIGLGPDTVKTTGVGYYNDTISIAKAHDNAIASAQCHAIADVLGMSMVSTTKSLSVSAMSIGNDGTENFACDDTFKSKAFSACAGFVESFRVVDEKQKDNALFVTIVAKVAKNKLMDDYRAYLQSMGDPGFCVRSNDARMIDVYSGFFGRFGLRMVGNAYDAAYLIDVIGRLETDVLTVVVTVRDRVSNSVLFSVPNTVQGFVASSATSAYEEALKGIIPQLHANLDQFIARSNADGRKVTVRLNNYDNEYATIANIIKADLEMVPGAKNVRKNSSTANDVFELTLNYIGEADDLATFLTAHIKTDIKRRQQRPILKNVQNTLVEFAFE